MIVYLTMLMISLLLYVLTSKKKTILGTENERVLFHGGRIYFKRTDLAVFGAAVPFILVSGFRYAVGTDYWATYYTGFYRVLENNGFDRFEFGYLAIVKIIQKITDNAFVLIFCLSLLFAGFTFKAIKEQSQDILFSVLLLVVTRYFFISMNAVRQFLAMAIILYSMKYILSRQRNKFLFWLFIAFSIHYMAILFLPMYYIAEKKINLKRFTIYCIEATAIIMVARNIVFRVLSNTRFGNSSRYDYAGLKFTIFTIVLNVLICVAYYSSYDESKDDLRYRLYLNIELVAMILAVFIGVIPAMERVYWIYSFPLIISIPYCIKKKYQIIRWMIVAIFIVYLVYDIMILNDHNVLPYQTIFGHEARHILWG